MNIKSHKLTTFFRFSISTIGPHCYASIAVNKQIASSYDPLVIPVLVSQQLSGWYCWVFLGLWTGKKYPIEMPNILSFFVIRVATGQSFIHTHRVLSVMIAFIASFRRLNYHQLTLILFFFLFFLNEVTTMVIMVCFIRATDPWISLK